MPVTPADIATAARTRRVELGLRQRDLAELAGVSERLIREIERGKPGLRLDSLLRVLEVLGYQLTLTQFDALRPGMRA